MLISSTEPASLRAIGMSSKVPEQFGADVLMHTKAGLVGVQRKEVNDFVASLRGHRVPTELSQMGKLAIGVWIIEGDWNWSSSGESLKVRGFTREQYLGAAFSIQSRGYWVITTRNMEETIAALSHLESWLSKESHDSMLRRPKPQGSWGKADSEDFRLWFWQTVPGIGVKQAKELDKAFAGKIPLRLTCDIEDLMNVPGMGNKRVEAIMELFGG